MNRTVDEINDEIKALFKERNKAKAVTADGVQIEVGMTLYSWDLGGIEVYVVSETADFQENRIWQTEPTLIMEDYADLYASADIVKEDRLKRAKADVARSERIYLDSVVRLVKLETQVEKDLNGRCD